MNPSHKENRISMWSWLLTLNAGKLTTTHRLHVSLFPGLGHDLFPSPFHAPCLCFPSLYLYHVPALAPVLCLCLFPCPCAHRHCHVTTNRMLGIFLIETKVQVVTESSKKDKMLLVDREEQKRCHRKLTLVQKLFNMEPFLSKKTWSFVAVWKFMKNKVLFHFTVAIVNHFDA